MQFPLSSSSASASTCPRLRHILTGTFNTLFLHLFTFDTLTRDLTLTLSLPARGPHQWLALGGFLPDLSHPSFLSGSSNDQQRRQGPPGGAGRVVVYATTWADPEREVSAWSVSIEAGKEDIRLINAREILAAGSYLAVQPPPYESRTSPSYGVKSSLHTEDGITQEQGSATSSLPRHLYQAGGPTGEVFELDPTTGAIGEQRQQLLFLPGGEGALEKADKSRKSLRYGAHNVDFDVNGLAYVADLGRNSILMYSRDSISGQLTLLSSTSSPLQGDGPRHVVPSPCGRWVFAVTEHTSFVDAYRLHFPSIDSTKSSSSRAKGDASGMDVPRLQHVQRVSLLQQGADPHDYRGDTVRLSPQGDWLFATTRGMTKRTKGLVRGWKLNLQNLQRPISNNNNNDDDDDDEDASRSVLFETPTSGGKANALEWAPRYPLEGPDPSSAFSFSPPPSSSSSLPTEDLAVLTDDEEGYLSVLQWDGRDLIEIARAQLPGLGATVGEQAGGQAGAAAAAGGKGSSSADSKEGQREGASHAIWLS